MKNIISSTFILILFCNNLLFTQINPDLTFGNNNELTDAYINFQRTNIYLKIPNDYAYSPGFKRYSKNSDLYFTAQESRMSLGDIEKIIVNEMKSVNKKDSLISEKVFVNDYQGLFLIATDESNRIRLGLLFGDSSFYAVLLGVAHEQDSIGQKELLDIFQSVVYNKSTDKFNEVNKNFTFDQSITGYKYLGFESNTYLYVPKDQENNPVNGFTFMLAPRLNEGDAKTAFLEILSKYKRHFNLDFTYPDPKIKEDINLNHATILYEKEFKAGGKNYYFLMSLLLAERSSLFFIANCEHNTKENRSLFLKTLKSVKIVE